MPARATVHLRLDWRDPLDVLAPHAEAPFAFALLSDGSPEGRWSYVGHTPFSTFRDLGGAKRALSSAPPRDGGPPFGGGAVGLAAYEFGARAETTAPQERRAGWPDLIGGLFDEVIAFDHHAGHTWVLASAPTEAEAEARAHRLATEVAAAPEAPALPRLRSTIDVCAWDVDYPSVVSEVIAAIASGEIFQANVARGWTGRLPTGTTPFDLLRALHARSPAPFAGYLRLPGAAIVSRSPERFIAVSSEGLARTSPIKGTRPRSPDREEDARLAAELQASEKDQAENLMIVDVMRNDLARACRAGTVEVEAFCALTSFSNVHHLVSTVTGRLAAGEDALSLFASAFPPASVTGAPKVQAMRVIARHEPPRGPYCGSLFWAGFDGAFDSNVLIRTLGLEKDARGWRWEARAGAGITADSDPRSEDAEAVQKARSVLAAFTA